MMGDNERLGLDESHLQSSSSAYPSPGHNTPRVQSPESVVRHRLNLSDLSRFGRANDRLSNLRSSSGAHNHEAIADADAASTQWRDELPKSHPYNKYSLADSCEVLPSDSLSQQDDDDDEDAETVQKHIALSYRGSERTLPVPQYDGTADAPSPAKRKASYFSLRSVTWSFKRARSGPLRSWVVGVCRGSARRLSLAYRRWKHQQRVDRRQFDAWRARMRRQHPAYPLMSHRDKSLHSFAWEGQRHDEWWQNGQQYRAPGHMARQFRGDGRG